MIVLGGVLPIVGFGPVVAARVDTEFAQTARGANRVRQFVERDHGAGVADQHQAGNACRTAEPCRAGTIKVAR